MWVFICACIFCDVCQVSGYLCVCLIVFVMHHVSWYLCVCLTVFVMCHVSGYLCVCLTVFVICHVSGYLCVCLHVVFAWKPKRTLSCVDFVRMCSSKGVCVIGKMLKPS